MKRAEKEAEAIANHLSPHNNERWLYIKHGALAGFKKAVELLKLYAQHDTRNDKLGLLAEIRKLDE